MRRERRGSQALEFALTFPMLATLLTGVVDYGWFLSSHHIAIDGARAGARAGAITDAEGDPVQAAIEATAAALSAQGVEGTAFADAWIEGSAPNRMVVVDVEIPYTALIGLLPTPPSIRSTVSMRLEAPAWQEAGT